MERSYVKKFTRKHNDLQFRTIDGEFVLASVSGKEEHIIYFWNAHYGHTDRILECECRMSVRVVVRGPGLPKIGDLHGSLFCRSA